MQPCSFIVLSHLHTYLCGFVDSLAIPTSPNIVNVLSLVYSMFSLPAVSSPPAASIGITVSKLPSGNITVTCPDMNLNCLVLVQSTNSPDQVCVGYINYSDPDRTATFTPETTDVSVVVVVYTWRGGESIFSGQLSHVSQLELPTSEFGVV